jgi:hypothetical protein
VALLNGEPPGRVLTRTAGCYELLATFSWGGEEPRPVPVTVPEVQEARVSISCLEAGAYGRTLRGEVRAFTGEATGSALEAVLRAVTEAAAISEAVLEARCVKVASPVVSDAAAVEELARELQASGVPVSFGRSWEAGSPAEVCVGAGEAGELEDLLRQHPGWEVV